MGRLIIYASRYGAAKRYAEELSARTGIPAVSFERARRSGGCETAVFFGGVYAGNVYGLRKAARRLARQPVRSLIVAPVGIADPADAAVAESLRVGIGRALPQNLRGKEKIVPLRGSLDCSRLGFFHRTLLKLLYKSMKNKREEELPAEMRALVQVYGRAEDFVDFSALEKIEALLHV